MPGAEGDQHDIVALRDMRPLVSHDGVQLVGRQLIHETARQHRDTAQPARQAVGDRSAVVEEAGAVAVGVGIREEFEQRVMAASLGGDPHGGRHQVGEEVTRDRGGDGERDQRADRYLEPSAAHALRECRPGVGEVRSERREPGHEGRPHHRQPAGQRDRLPAHEGGRRGAARPRGTGEEHGERHGQHDGERGERDGDEDHAGASPGGSSRRRRWAASVASTPPTNARDGEPVGPVAEHLMHQLRHVLGPAIDRTVAMRPSRTVGDDQTLLLQPPEHGEDRGCGEGAFGEPVEEVVRGQRLGARPELLHEGALELAEWGAGSCHGVILPPVELLLHSVEIGVR